MSYCLESALDAERKQQADAADAQPALNAWALLPGFIRRSLPPTGEQLAAVLAALGGLPCVRAHQSLQVAIDAAHEFAEDVK
jgi:hypothetical protein